MKPSFMVGSSAPANTRSKRDTARRDLARKVIAEKAVLRAARSLPSVEDPKIIEFVHSVQALGFTPYFEVK